MLVSSCYCNKLPTFGALKQQKFILLECWKPRNVAIVAPISLSTVTLPSLILSLTSFCHPLKAASQGGSGVKKLPTKQEMQVWSLSQEDLWRRKWHPIPVFLPGKSHGERSLVGYSPRSCKELDMAHQLNDNSHLKGHLWLHIGPV